jgi:hypothetical protein
MGGIFCPEPQYTTLNRQWTKNSTTPCTIRMKGLKNCRIVFVIFLLTETMHSPHYARRWKKFEYFAGCYA